MLVLADVNMPAGTLKQATCIVMGVPKGQISREHCDAEQTFSNSRFATTSKL